MLDKNDKLRSLYEKALMLISSQNATIELQVSSATQPLCLFFFNHSDFFRKDTILQGGSVILAILNNHTKLFIRLLFKNEL